MMYQEAVSHLQSVIAKRARLISIMAEQSSKDFMKSWHEAQTKDKRLMKFIVEQERKLKVCKDV